MEAELVETVVEVVGWDPDWRYQAIVTNLDWDPVDVWRFYYDRGGAERVFKVGKQALAIGWLVSRDLCGPTTTAR